ncbi:hypothetical protein ONZ45_g15451 [Pleurotus djamor]|nr:hypothetical protein ONZ45_g15451 [Pleurotus djamor]
MPDYHDVSSSCDFSGQNVVVVGGTQGIGAGIALRFAELGASVLIVGRNSSLGNGLLESMKAKAKTGPSLAKFAFVQKDLGVLKEIKEAAEEIAVWAGDDGVSYLFQSQGGIAYFMPAKPEDAPIGFNVQVMSHFLIPYLLATRNEPSLRKGAQICHIGRPGASIGSLDVDNMQQKASSAWIVEFNARFPETHTTHLYPGQVATKGLSVLTLPWFIRYIAQPLVTFIGKTPAQYADIVVYQIASDEGKALKRTFWDQYSKEVKVDKRILSDHELREKVWDALIKLGEAA